MTVPGSARTVPAAHADAARVDVVALGESMVTFLPSRPGRLADVPSFDRGIGGAESNVACGLALAGHTVKWISRVGADGFGDHLLERIASYGVDVGAVQRDPLRPTGIYFRTAGERAVARAAGSPGERDAAALSEVVYYRTGSAASVMSPATMPAAELDSGHVLHLSGITPALSDDCLALVRQLTAPRPGRPLVSFDVNYRVSLWRDPAEAGETLLALARDADLVFVGEDEAEAAWGVTGGPEAIRDALPEPDLLVVKQGAHGVTLFEGNASKAHRFEEDTVTFAPALHVSVVAPVGAGDAFAAGFLSATLRGLGARDRLRHGHLMAAGALTVPGDIGTVPSRALADRLAALDEHEWGTLRLGPGWTEAVAEGAKEEVHTP
ncbi:sugar kinase [Streptomyces cavernae]|uniref:sugar kinase n=1 Tax=Streptomyces cavernae TaxID=2259034 RepID=UPI002367BCEA|nr:sugar kinase [Streptomyces cavernae]